MYYIGTVLEGCIDVAPAEQAVSGQAGPAAWARLGGFAQAGAGRSIGRENGRLGRLLVTHVGVLASCVVRVCAYCALLCRFFFGFCDLRRFALLCQLFRFPKSAREEKLPLPSFQISQE